MWCHSNLAIITDILHPPYLKLLMAHKLTKFSLFSLEFQMLGNQVPTLHTPQLYLLFCVSYVLQTLVIDSNLNSQPGVMSFCFPFLYSPVNLQPLL